MPIIVGGKVVNLSQPKAEEVVSATPVQQIEEVVPPTPPKRVVFNRKADQPKIKGGNTLVVNGKAKTIGRKSQYLLDMMIIDEE